MRGLEWNSFIDHVIDQRRKRAHVCIRAIGYSLNIHHDIYIFQGSV